MSKLFVYGTLMRGYGNNRLLETAPYVGRFMVNGSLYGFGIPGYSPVTHADEEHSVGVVGEVYEVDDDTLARCDRLEGHPNHYRRIEAEAVSIDEVEGETDTDETLTVFIYEYPNAADRGDYIPSGDYREYRSCETEGRW